MLAKITILTSLLFATIYPLCFWISADNPLKDKFHKFHLGLPNVIGGVLLVFIILLDFPLFIKIAVVIWKLTLFGLSRLEWKKKSPRPWIITIASIMGLITFALLHNHLIQEGWQNLLMWYLSGIIFCSAFYAMNLGHWYLNVHGLPMSHLMRATYVFWIALGVRLSWDIVKLLTSTVIYRGNIIPLWKFSITMEGFLICVGIFFGTLFPIGTLYFVKETIKLKNPQSATGILYTILCAVILGDMTYKYFLIRYSISL